MLCSGCVRFNSCSEKAEKEMKLPKYVLSIISRINSAGYEAYLVGGCVRDTVMGREPSDFDIATSARPSEIISLFPKTVTVGEKYGTVIVICGENRAEVTTFRTDGDYRDGRRPERVSFSESLKDDLKRRDFTVNAMAMDSGGKIYDFYGGTDDIKRKIIRIVGNPKERFSEDALRILRAVRFSAKLGFEIEEDTKKAMYEMRTMVKALSRERVRDELIKTLMTDNPQKAAQFISLSAFSNVSDDISRDFSVLNNVKCDEEHRLTAFCAELMRAGAISDGISFLKDMRFPSKTAKSCGAAAKIAAAEKRLGRVDIKTYMCYHGTAVCKTALEVRKTFTNYGEISEFEDIIAKNECYNLKMLDLSAADLIKCGVTGEGIGKGLDAALEYAIGRTEKTNKDDILLYLKQKGMIK